MIYSQNCLCKKRKHVLPYVERGQIFSLDPPLWNTLPLLYLNQTSHPSPDPLTPTLCQLRECGRWFHSVVVFNGCLTSLILVLNWAYSFKSPKICLGSWLAILLRWFLLLFWKYFFVWQLLRNVDHTFALIDCRNYPNPYLNWQNKCSR